MCDICFNNENNTTKYCCSNLCNKCFLKLKGICPICQRDELNIQITCEKCKNKFSLIEIDNCDVCKKNICKECSYYKNKYIGLCKKKCVFKFINNLYNNKSDLFTFKNLSESI